VTSKDRAARHVVVDDAVGETVEAVALANELAAIALILAGVTQFACGFSRMRINSGASISVEKLRMGTLAAMPS
jgi:hypothetical protein